MGYDLTLLTDDELQRRIMEIDRRREKLGTVKGRIEAEDNFAKIFKYLKVYGYKADIEGKEEESLRTKIWLRSLSDEIAVYGFGGIWEAIESFVNSDTREYRPMPMPADIIAACRKLGRNPKAEMARREQARREAELEAKWANERDAYRSGRKGETALDLEQWLEDLRARYPLENREKV